MFDAAEKALPTHTPKPGALIPAGANADVAYATLALGSALALFLYPHAVTAVLSAKSAQTIRRNTALLPAYTFLLGLIALLGYMAIARGISPENPNFAVPDLFLNVFPSWFVGVAFAAIAIGALVPAAVMSIAAANLFTRSIYKEYLRKDASHADEARMAKIVSLGVKLGALVIIVTLPTKYAIELQLLGGVWILQTLPAIVIGLYTRWLHRWALVAGWAVGMTVGTLMAASQDFAATYPLDFFGTTINAYTGVFALTANLVVTLTLSRSVRAMKTSAGLVLYRVRDGELQVLLGHMGGPLWARKDDGAWSIPKGELDPGEDPLAGARREFAEELGHAPPDGDVLELGEIRQRAGKRVIGFAVEGDFDPETIVPGTFEMTWPPRSGRTQAFPEVDRVAWFDLATAERKLVRGQMELLVRLAAARAGG